MAVQRLGCKHWILDAPEGQRGRILKEGEMLKQVQNAACCFLNGETSLLFKRLFFSYFSCSCWQEKYIYPYISYFFYKAFFKKAKFFSKTPLQIPFFMI